MNAAVALRAYSGLPHSLTAVEAEPTHFRWLQLHCADNGVDATLIHAAVASTRGTVEFAVGEPASWYGQAIADGSWSPERVDTVAAVTLSDLLTPLGSVDLIHCDIQGAEAEVFEEAAQSLDAQVKRVHVGTHGAAAEQRVRNVFSSLRWKKLNDYPCGTSGETPFGAMGFQDGVQTWLNTRLSGHPSTDRFRQ